MGMHSSGIGKFMKKDPNHGRWGRWLGEKWNKLLQFLRLRKK